MKKEGFILELDEGLEIEITPDDLDALEISPASFVGVLELAEKKVTATKETLESTARKQTKELLDAAVDSFYDDLEDDEEYEEEELNDTPPLTINDWVEVVHKNAREKGWWDEPRSPLDIHMLCVSEIAEATEEVRKGKPDYYYCDSGKPEGEPVELADAVIRIMDYFGKKGWDLEKTISEKMVFNKTRPKRHGGKVY